MQFHQGLAIFLILTTLYSWYSRHENIAKLATLIDTDKRDRKKILDNFFIVYFFIVSIITCLVFISPKLRFLIEKYLNIHFTTESVAMAILFIFLSLSFFIRKFFKPLKNNKNIIATPYSTYGLKPKLKKIGIIEGAFLENQKKNFLNFTIRADDYTIQKINFNKEAILMKKIYLEKIFKYDRFTENDKNILEKIENQISSRNDFNFKNFPTVEGKIIQLIEAIQSQNKFTFPFGQIIQYSESYIIDDLLVFLQDIQEDRYCSSSLPYLLIFKQYIK